ncbi:class I SAM-dependent methyltransferase [Flexivirga sp. B27]
MSEQSAVTDSSPRTDRTDPNLSTWTQSAPAYETHFNWNDAGERVAVQQVADAVRGGRVLDVGVGAGRTSWLLGLLTHQYTGVDSTPAMVSAAARNCPWADIRLGDASALDFADESFDLVFFSNAGIDSMNHAQRSRALSEFARVLRPDGILLYSTLNRSGPFFGAHPGPLHAPGKLPTPYRVGRFAARAMLHPGAHLSGFRHVRQHADQFEDHGDWAIDTMPTHDWSLVVHYITTRGARAEVTEHGFGATTLLDQYGLPIEDSEAGVDTAWFYVLARHHAEG